MKGEEMEKKEENCRDKETKSIENLIKSHPASLSTGDTIERHLTSEWVDAPRRRMETTLTLPPRSSRLERFKAWQMLLQSLSI